MYDSHEKGTNVTHTGHSPKTPRIHSAVFATLRAFLHIPGSGAPLDRSVPTTSVVAVAVLVAATCSFAVPTLARAETKGPPTIEGFQVIYVHATRAHVHVVVNVNGSDVEGQLESAPGPAGPWTPGASNKALAGTGSSIELAEIYLHLTPSHTYYVRVKAKNNSGEAERTFTFTTAPIGPPEVGIGGFDGDQGTNRGTDLQCITRLSSGECIAEIDTNGAETEYHFEDSTAANGIYTPVLGCTGTITVAEDFAFPRCPIEGLTPGTTYFVRIVATNAVGTGYSHVRYGSLPSEEKEYFELTTIPAHPQAFLPSVSDVTSTSAELNASLKADNSETEWQLQYAVSAGGEWKAVPGGSGTISAAEANEAFQDVGAHLTGLSPASTYYVRLFAENAHGSSTSAPSSLKTGGPPAATAFAVHTFAFGGEAIRLLGSVEPGGTATNELQTLTISGGATGGTFTLTLDGHTTAPIAFIPHATEGKEFKVTPEEIENENHSYKESEIGGENDEESEMGHIEQALDALPNLGTGRSYVYGGAGPGSFTVEFAGVNAGVNLPQITADPSGLAPSGTVSVATLEDGVPLTVDYHFQYVTQERFEREGFAHPEETPEVEGSGVVGQNLPALRAGVGYDYRLVATDSSAGRHVVDSGERTLSVPSPAPVEQPASCPNESLRFGPSASLPDCRAYEQVTPTEKAGSEDTFKYGVNSTYTAIGEDGEHVFFSALGVHWGSAQADPVNSNYVFSRAAGGWQMTSTALAPEAGVADTYQPTLFSADLTQLAFPQVGWIDGEKHISPQVRVEVGAPGGPYATVATVPRTTNSATTENTEVVAASADFGKLIVKTNDRSLLPGRPSTTTGAGDDLYEYSEGQLRRLNVAGGTPGSPISTCGASLAHGAQGYGGNSYGEDHYGPRSVSAEGTRVFFEDNCTHHLYMRVNGAETVDLGEYTFVAANAEGTRLLLENPAGEFFLYDTESATAKLLFRAQVGRLIVSEDLTAVYFTSQESLTPEAPPIPSTGAQKADIYAYNIAAGTLQFIAEGLGASNGVFDNPSVSPDGRYLYWEERGIGGAPVENEQVYRYDGTESVVQCMSCASSFDPEPKYRSTFFQAETLLPPDSVPNPTVSSSNGDYVFFYTVSALVPQDVDGEIAPEGTQGVNASVGGDSSPSGDVYEWRKNGIDGCAHVQGCIQLITSGRGGFNNVLLGTDPSGRDIFFATHESLAPQDNDIAADIYDARIGGGYPPPPPRAVECEGDACSTPPSAPVDSTPSSFTFAGAGNLVQPPTAQPVVKAKKPKPKKQRKLGKRRGKSKRKTRKAKKSSHGKGRKS